MVFKERSAESTHILIAPDPREEVAWVLRRAMQAADAGTPLHRMAVLYRQAQPYARLVREQCGLADIPIAGPSASALGESAAGRALSGLLRLAAGDLAREEVMAWLTGCPIVPPQGAAESFHPSQWDRISRAAGIVRGREQWRDRLDRYATERERQAENAEVREERSEAALRWMAREASDARALGAFIEDLASDLASAEELRTWQDRADWALRLLERYMGRRGGFPEAEAAAWELVTDGLQELPSAGAVRTEVTFDAFADAVQELLASTTGHSGRTGTGLFVATFGAALGMEFDRVFLVGMVEGAVPPRVVDDPLLPDQARRRASAASDEDGTGIPLRGTRARDERYAYLAALASAPDRVLSFPKGDPASQRGQFPSRWVLEQASILEGARVFSTTLERLGARSWLTRVASRQDALRRAGEGAAVDLHDHDLRSLSGWRDRGLAVAAHHLATAGTRLHQALAMLGSRAGTALSPWEGDVSALAPTSRRLRPAAERRVMSPTRLQTWAKCPFQYFLGSVLGLAALESPEETEVISPLDKGSLVHGVLERFLRKAVEDGPPAPGEPWSPEHRAMLREMAEEAFRDMEARGLTGKAFLWGLERELMLDDLDEFLRQDAKLREELGSTPWLLEMAFGFAPGPGGETATAPELTLADGTTLAFRGMIDRIDRTADGGVLVFDYKTGSDWPYRALDKDPVDRGRLLQLPLYGMAARQVVGPGAPVRSAYWFVTTKGGFVRRPSTPLPLDAAMPAFQEAVTVITAGIGNGYFPANPGSEKSNCMFCDFDKLCGVRREGVWERKRRDPRLGAYVRLAGEAGDESEQ